MCASPKGWCIDSNQYRGGEVSYGQYAVIAGLLIAASTLKRPVFLGGSRRRHASDENVSAMMNRASKRSLGGWLIFGGAMMWLVGI